MTIQTDLIAPSEIGEDRLGLSIDPSCLPMLAMNNIIINIDYSAVGANGVTLPIEFIVQPPSVDGIGYVRRVYRKHVPSSIVFFPITAGRHLVLVKECCHNLWQGRLVIDVGGDEADKLEPLDRL